MMMIGLYFVEVEASCDWLRFNLWQLLCPKVHISFLYWRQFRQYDDFRSDIFAESEV
jgi:hypothetical protein